MDLFNDEITALVQHEIIEPFVKGEDDRAIEAVVPVLEALYAAIPDNKRISYGRYYTIKVLGVELSDVLKEAGLSLFEIGVKMYDRSDDYRTRGVALAILSYYGLGDLQRVLPYFEDAAGHEHWEAREFAASFFKKLVRAHPQELKGYLTRLVQSENPNLRRFVSEMLRPVADNQWLYKDINYSLSILRHLFTESKPYPRTSVGNNLSDIARRHPELVYELVAELVAMNDKHAYWIAYRACRNLVKKEPIRVMDLLGVDEYKYKKRVHRRVDYA
jgi:3-methyladenine DNA glycosylase AlkC